MLRNFVITFLFRTGFHPLNPISFVVSTGKVKTVWLLLLLLLLLLLFDVIYTQLSASYLQ